MSISVNYFLTTILSNVGNANYNYNMSGVSVNGELDSTSLLDQTLQVEEIINCVKICSLKITHFWQIASSESLSSDQIAYLEEVSIEIS